MYTKILFKLMIIIPTIYSSNTNQKETQKLLLNKTNEYLSQNNEPSYINESSYITESCNETNFYTNKNQKETDKDVINSSSSSIYILNESIDYYGKDSYEKKIIELGGVPKAKYDELEKKFSNLQQENQELEKKFSNLQQENQKLVKLLEDKKNKNSEKEDKGLDESLQISNINISDDKEIEEENISDLLQELNTPIIKESEIIKETNITPNIFGILNSAIKIKKREIEIQEIERNNEILTYIKSLISEAIHRLKEDILIFNYIIEIICFHKEDQKTFNKELQNNIQLSHNNVLKYWTEQLNLLNSQHDIKNTLIEECILFFDSIFAESHPINKLSPISQTFINKICRTYMKKLNENLQKNSQKQDDKTILENVSMYYFNVRYLILKYTLPHLNAILCSLEDTNNTYLIDKFQNDKFTDKINKKIELIKKWNGANKEAISKKLESCTLTNTKVIIQGTEIWLFKSYTA